MLFHALHSLTDGDAKAKTLLHATGSRYLRPGDNCNLGLNLIPQTVPPGQESDLPSILYVTLNQLLFKHEVSTNF